MFVAKEGVVFFLVLVFSFGCAKDVIDISEGPAPGVRVRDSQAPHARVMVDRVVIIDKGLQKWDTKKVEYWPNWLSIFFNGYPENQKNSKIAVEKVGTKKTPVGATGVWAVFRNRTDYPLVIECRVQFFGKNLEPVEGPSAWQKVYLPPQGVSNYKENSITLERIEHFYIEVRSAV